MLDELRSMDWVPRLVRSRSSKLESATRSLESELGRTPTNHELAARLGLSKSDFEKVHRDATAVTVISLSRKYYETDSNRDILEIDVVEDSRAIDPETEQGKFDVKELVSKLSRIEQLILVLYYFEGMTMKEIGNSLYLSESRVSQMHSAIIQHLKAIAGERFKKLVPAS